MSGEQFAKKIDEIMKRLDQLEATAHIRYGKSAYTPTYIGGTTAGTTTYTFQDGAWIRKGNEVTARGQINWSAATGTGDAQISLPFAASAANFTGALWLINVTFAAGTPEMRLGSGNAYFTMISPATNAAGTVVQVEAGGTIIWVVTYFI